MFLSYSLRQKFVPRKRFWNSWNIFKTRIEYYDFKKEISILSQKPLWNRFLVEQKLRKLIKFFHIWIWLRISFGFIIQMIALFWRKSVENVYYFIIKKGKEWGIKEWVYKNLKCNLNICQFYFYFLNGCLHSKKMSAKMTQNRNFRRPRNTFIKYLNNKSFFLIGNLQTTYRLMDSIIFLNYPNGFRRHSLWE